MNYEAQINALIPLAESMADARIKGMRKTHEKRSGKYREGNNGTEYIHCFWSQYFHEAMNKLAQERGLRA